MSESDELAEILSNGPTWNVGVVANEVAGTSPQPPAPEIKANYVQWTSPDGKRFFPAARTKKALKPGLYDILLTAEAGLFFEWVPVKTEGVIRFPHTNTDFVVNEIQRFWAQRERFVRYGLTHKRGIMLWGPPGSGKSCTIQLVMKDVIDRGGVALRFTSPGLFSLGLRILREVQPETPVVVLMEDMDSLVRQYSETDILNLLDGAELVDRTVFLASTNYPELLGARIMNRPSRFDRRIKVPFPTEESRRIYLESLLSRANGEAASVDVERWANDTDGFSFAHLKELFVGVVILENDYDETVKTLKSMKEQISSEQFNREQAGFANLQKQKQVQAYYGPGRR
jgi:hypothetical protein